MDVTILGAALLMGAVGSLHCVGMCGPLALSMNAHSGADRSFAMALSHLGRVTTYGALGAVAGGTGEALSTLAPLHVVQLVARVVAALSIVFVGLYLAGFLPNGGSSRVGGWVTRLFAYLSPKAAYLRGLLWGLIPCGLVFGALTLALSGRSAVGGASVMVLFGAGTLPALLLVGLLSSALKLELRGKRLRRGVGLVLMASAAVQLSLALVSANVLPVPAEERPCCASKPHH